MQVPYAVIFVSISFEKISQHSVVSFMGAAYNQGLVTFFELSLMRLINKGGL